jgi:hypothetical protein
MPITMATLSPEQTLARWGEEQRASVPACPPWCTLPAGHPWDEDGPGAVLAREHVGPGFGALFEARGLEHADRRGHVAVSIMVDDHAYRDSDPRTVVELLWRRRQAGRCDWIRHVQREAVLEQVQGQLFDLRIQQEDVRQRLVPIIIQEADGENEGR